MAAARMLARDSRIALADPDPLVQWQQGLGQRVALQAEVIWPALHDGYAVAGAADPAAPYAHLWWELGPVKTDHCPDCPWLAFNSPYAPPGSGGNELAQTPGDGRTECGAGCKCSLRYGGWTLPEDSDWIQYMTPPDAPWMNEPANPGRIPPTVRSGPGWDIAPGPIGVDARGNYVYPGTPEEAQLGRPPAPALYGTIREELSVAAIDAAQEELTASQKGAMDSFRRAWAGWDRVRGDRPAARALFGYVWDAQRGVFARPGPTAGALYPTTSGYVVQDERFAASWDELSPAQQRALARLWDAVVGWNDATTDAVQSDVAMAEWAVGEVIRLGGTNPYRDAKGRYTNGPHAPREGEGEGRGGAGSRGEADREAGKGGGGTRAITVENVHVEGRRSGRELIHEHLGRTVTDEQIARLAGARAGDHVSVGSRGSAQIEVRSADGSHVHTVWVQRGDDGRPVLRQQLFQDGHGHEIAMDPHVVAIQAHAAHELGVARIETKARIPASDHINLPRLGYDTSMREALHESRLNTSARMPMTRPLPASARSARNLSDFLKTSAGRTWWRENGLAPHMEFDPSPGSASMQQLGRALQEDVHMAEKTRDDIVGRPYLPSRPWTLVEREPHTTEEIAAMEAAIESAKNARPKMLREMMQFAEEPDDITAIEAEIARIRHETELGATTPIDYLEPIEAELEQVTRRIMSKYLI